MLKCWVDVCTVQIDYCYATLEFMGKPQLGHLKVIKDKVHFSICMFDHVVRNSKETNGTESKKDVSGLL